MSAFARHILATVIALLAVVGACADDLRSIMRQADSLYQAEQLEQAIPHYARLAELYEIGQTDPALCQSLQNAGDACFFTNHYVEALQYYTYAVQLAEQYRNVKVYDTSTSYIGTTYALFNDYERSIHYFLKAYQSAIENKNERLKCQTLVNLVASYAYMGKAQKAQEFLEKQRENPLEDSLQHHYRLLYNQGVVARAVGDYIHDIRYMQQLREFIAANHLNDSFLASVNLEMARAENKLGHYRPAIELAKQTQAVADENKFLYLLNESYLIISDTYAKMQLKDSALVYQGMSAALVDTVFNQRKFNQAKDKLFRYEEQVTDRQMVRMRSWIMMLGLLVLSLAVICAVIFYYNRKLNSTYQILVDKNKEVLRQNDELRKMRTEAIAESQALDIEPPKPVLTPTEPETEPEAVETAKATLDEARTRQLAQRIEQVLDDIDIITDPEFSLQVLAGHVGSNMKYVSAVVNQVYQKNFKSLLNEYRVREACRRLQDEEHYGNMTIQAIAETVGYHNVNNFIVAFKRVMGMPPSKYKQLAKNAPQP